MSDIEPWQVTEDRIRHLAIHRPWRTGRSIGRTVYVMARPSPSSKDSLIGLFDTPELARAAVIAHNQLIERTQS